MNIEKLTLSATTLALAATMSLAAPRKAADITVSGYTGSTPLENFPVLVRISPERIFGFSYADCVADGRDIAFEDAQGNALDREIDTWNPNGESLVWVRVPSLANNMALTLTYQDSTVTAPPPCQTNGAVWAPAGYIGVWHMNESNAKDSSARGYNGTASVNSIVPTEGVVGSALQFANAGQISCGNTPNSEIASGFSVECWLYVQDATTRAFMGKNACISLRMGGQTFTLTTPGVKDHNLSMGAPTASWFHFCTTFLPSASHGIKVYRDGVFVTSTDTSAIPNPSSSSELLLGNNQWSTRMYGKIDEIRLASVVHSPDWVAASAATQSGSSFLTYGSMRDLASLDLLIVSGFPDQIGSPTPSYGNVSGLSVNDEVALSMPSAVVVGEGTVTNRLVGWKLESVDVDTSVRTPVRSSSDVGEAIDRCDYVHAGCAEFTWLWDVRDVVGVGAPAAAETGENYLTLSADVTGIGYTAPSATLKFAYGVSPDALVYTNVASSSVTAIGTYTAMITRLTPGVAYYVKAILETNDAAQDVAESDVVCLLTASLDERFGEPGLLQAKYANKWYTGDWDIEGASDADRVLGAWAAHCGNNFSGTMPWKSADGTTTYSTWGDNTTWGYVGSMYFRDATYTFGGCMDDNVRLSIDGEQVLDQSGSTLKTQNWAPPNGAGWYPIEIRVGNGTGGYGPYGGFYGLCWNTTGYTTKDTSANWSKFVDPGDGSLLRTVSGPTITASENISAGALSSIGLSFTATESARTLRVASGPVRGGDNPADWFATRTIATVAAGASSYSFVPPADWGSDSNLVVRFYFDGDPVDWSNSIYWRDYTAPSVTDFAADGTGGDTVVVSGTLDSFPGANCTLTVYTGDSPTALEHVWTGSTLYATGDFSITLHEPDTSAARYLTPGETYYVAVEAASGGQVTRTSPLEVTMSAAPVFLSSSATVTRRTVTFKGLFSDVGAGTSATVTLYAGPSSAAEGDLVAVEAPITVTARNEFSIAHTFPDFETTYKWQLRATAETDGGTSNFETRTAVASCKTLDTTTYTWKTGVTSGNWDDPANWTDNQGGDSLGYPQSSAATAVFTAGNSASVAFRQALTVGTLNLSAANVDVTFVQGGASTNATRLTANTLNLNGARGLITLDGVAIYAGSGVTLGANRALTLVNGANLFMGDFSNENYNEVTIAGGSWLSCNQMFFGSGTITIDDSVVWTRSHDYIGRTRTGGRVVFKGAHPVWRHNNNGGYFFSNIANANVQLDFIVPVGGFPEAPIQAPSNQSYAMGNNGNNAAVSALTINVLDESPANFADATVTSPLVSWPNKGIGSSVLEGRLPVDAGVTDDEFVWDDQHTPPRTLDVRIVGASHSCQLQISGAPESVDSQDVSPAYGYHALANGATQACTAPAGYQQISETKRAICAGWKLYDVNAATLARTLADSGTGTSCSVTGNGGWRELEWQWRVEYKVSVTASAGGTAEAESVWVADGDVARLHVTPAAGYAFGKWTGDVDAANDKTQDLSFQVCGTGYALTATFLRAYYVSTTGNDANGGTGWDDALATVQAALAKDANAYVYVADGIYPQTDTITLSGGATIAGTNNACGAIFKAVGKIANGSLFLLRHVDARLLRLAITTGFTGSNGDFARGVYLDGNGLVDSCVITNCRSHYCAGNGGGGVYLYGGGIVRNTILDYNSTYASGGNNAKGHNICMTGGLVENCAITRGGVRYGASSSGGGVFMQGGTLRNCLVSGGTQGHDNADGATGVLVFNGTASLIENCTIAGNYHGSSVQTKAFYVNSSANCTIRNSIIWGNVNNGGVANWGAHTSANLTAEKNCSIPALPGRGNISLDPAFVDENGGDYHLTLSAAVDGAATQPWMAAATDLDGKPRVIGADADLGCYEFDSDGISCGFDVFEAGLLDIDDVTLAARVVGGDPSTLSFVWTLTDSTGNTIATNGVGLATVTLPVAAGLYDVSLVVSDGSTSASSVRPALLRVYGSDVFVDPAGGNVYPYSTRATAATNLLDAIEAASDGTTVHLSDGWHRIAKTLSIAVGAHLVSDNGPAATTIFGRSVTSGAPLVIVNHGGAVIDGITISGRDSDRTQPQQWSGVRVTSAGGMLTNCVVRDHRTVSISVHGAGARLEGGTVVDCVFSNNFVACSGGGGMRGGAIDMTGANALVDRCVITNNMVSDGGVSYGGGVYANNGTVRNCLIVGNSCAKGYGGGLAVTGSGRAFNCTVVRNTATTANGGIWQGGGTVQDCLAWNNTANGIPEDQADPGFIDAEGGDYHLNVASVAVDSGTVSNPGALDLDLMPRVSGVRADKGCYEYDQNQFSIGISFDAETPFEESPVVFTAAATPAGTVLDNAMTWWTFDGSEPTATNIGASGAVVTNALPAGIYTVRFKTVYNGREYSFDRPDWVIRYGRTVYLVEENEGAAPPYATPETAATNLMRAFTYAIDGCTLLIGDGTFRITAEQILERHIAIRSVNGPSRTTIDATHSLRPFVIKSKDVVLDGLRLYRGHNWAQGGAVQMVAAATITNCVFDSCRIQNNGGAGVYMTAGTVVDSVFTNCHTVSAYCDTQDGVAIWANGASCLIDRCLVVDSNEQGTKGNGAVCIAQNGGTVRNTVVSGSRMRKCGGIVLGADGNGNGSGKAINCTVTGNVTTTSGETAGVAALGASSVVRNTILWNNVNEADEQRAETSGAAARFDHCSTEDPIFVGRPGREFLIRSNSPCRDAGVTEPWMTGALDFYGKPRIDKPAKPVDIGAAECQKTEGTLVIMR